MSDKTKPTLEQVKEYFKDAKVIRMWANDKLYTMDDVDRLGIHEYMDGFWGCNEAQGNFVLWGFNCYAEIVEYKSNAFDKMMGDPLEEIEVMLTLTGNPTNAIQKAIDDIEELSNYQKAMASVEALIPDDLETRHQIYTIMGELSVQEWKEGYSQAKENHNK